MPLPTIRQTHRGRGIIMSKLSDTEIATLATKTADEIDRRRNLENIERLTQVARLEAELREARKLVEDLTSSNAQLLGFVSQLAGKNGGSTVVVPSLPPVPYHATPQVPAAPAPWAPAVVQS